MGNIQLKTCVMAGPMRWVVLTTAGRVTTLAWFVDVRYTPHGSGHALFARSDVRASGHDDVRAVFSDNARMATYLRDEIFSYSEFSGVTGHRQPAPVCEATFTSRNDWPESLVESMTAADGTTLTLLFWALGEPRAYVRAVNEAVTEVGAYAVPARFRLEVNGATAVGQAEIGPLAEAPAVGADVQNLWYTAG